MDHGHTLKVLTQKLILCSDTYGTYGLSPEAMKSKIQAFYEVLKPFSTQAIEKSFSIWIAENSKMPTPADIRKIAITWFQERPQATTGAPQFDSKKYHELTEEQQKQVDDCMVRIKANLAPPEEKKIPKEPDYTHFNRLSEAQKQQHNQDFVASWERLKNGETVF